MLFISRASGMKSGKKRSEAWLAELLVLAAAILAPALTSSGQAPPIDAISREVSVFNFGQSSASVEAISREVSVFNFGQDPISLEAISREVSIFNLGQSPSTLEVTS